MVTKIHLTFSTSDLNYILLSAKNVVLVNPGVTVTFEFNNQLIQVTDQTNFSQLKTKLNGTTE